MKNAIRIDFYDPSTTPGAEYKLRFFCAPVVVCEESTQMYLWRLIQYCDINKIFYNLEYIDPFNFWILSIEHKPFTL